MNTTDPFKSRKFKAVIFGLCALLFAAIIFQAGIAVGYHRAAFSYNWNNAYFQGTRDPHSPFAAFMMRDADDPNPHGTIGQVVSVRLPEVMIKGRDTPEQIVVIGPTTAIRRFHEIGTTTDLSTGQQVIVIGSPDDKGQIQASFIRIMPPLPGTASSSSSIK
jgi:hypothetical protein